MWHRKKSASLSVSLRLGAAACGDECSLSPIVHPAVWALEIVAHLDLEAGKAFVDIELGGDFGVHLVKLFLKIGLPLGKVHSVLAHSIGQISRPLRQFDLD